jgi:hypothetical protein
MGGYPQGFLFDAATNMGQRPDKIGIGQLCQARSKGWRHQKNLCIKSIN